MQRKTKTELAHPMLQPRLRFLDVWQGADRRWYIREVTPQGRVCGDGGQGYSTRSKAVRAANAKVVVVYTVRVVAPAKPAKAARP